MPQSFRGDGGRSTTITPKETYLLPIGGVLAHVFHPNLSELPRVHALRSAVDSQVAELLNGFLNMGNYDVVVLLGVGHALHGEQVRESIILSAHSTIGYPN